MAVPTYIVIPSGASSTAHVLPELLIHGFVLYDPSCRIIELIAPWSTNEMQKSGLHEVRDIVQFVLEINELKGVLRKVKPVAADRYESTAEHSLACDSGQGRLGCTLESTRGQR